MPQPEAPASEDKPTSLADALKASLAAARAGARPGRTTSETGRARGGVKGSKNGAAATAKEVPPRPRQSNGAGKAGAAKTAAAKGTPPGELTGRAAAAGELAADDTVGLRPG